MKIFRVQMSVRFVFSENNIFEKTKWSLMRGLDIDLFYYGFARLKRGRSGVAGFGWFFNMKEILSLYYTGGPFRAICSVIWRKFLTPAPVSLKTPRRQAFARGRCMCDFFDHGLRSAWIGSGRRVRVLGLSAIC